MCIQIVRIFLQCRFWLRTSEKGLRIGISNRWYPCWWWRQIDSGHTMIEDFILWEYVRKEVIWTAYYTDQYLFLILISWWLSVQFSSVQSLSRVRIFVTPWTAAHPTPCPSQTPGVYWNSFPLSGWYHPAISSSVVLSSSHLQSFPASGSFPMSQLFMSGGQSIGISGSASVLPMNIQDWFPLGWTGWISLQSKGLSRVFSNTAVQKHQFFCAQLSL